jgi:hypothetical protein
MCLSGRISISCVLAIFLAFTASAEDKYVKSKEPVFPQVQSGRALVYFARPDFTRLIPEATFKVFVDSTPVGWLPQRSYIACQIEPGSRVVWGTATKRFNFESGKVYFLILIEQYGMNRAIVDTSWESGPAEAVQAFVADRKLTYVQANEESIATLREEGEKKFKKEEKRAPAVTTPTSSGTLHLAEDQPNVSVGYISENHMF